MPKQNDIKRICILGAGPIIIGQACEFDYAGAQACKALREEGYYLILINSNPATIMTDPGMADATYIEPLDCETVTRILEHERPDALLPTMGGQTALNLAMQLSQNGTLNRLGITLIGASETAIAMAEDRQLFKQAMARIGLETPRAVTVTSLAEAEIALAAIGLPAIIRPSFTLGGTGGGIARDRQGFFEIVTAGLAASPIGSVLIEESLLGWKEYEMEVVRDAADNAIIICSIENLDPMGVHTGDSITVAPALTLTDKEYQKMRDAAMAVLREIGVETGGSNVQFAVNPDTGRMLVIEMNPRVSRSSALASKATGFPIARVAAKLAIGYRLDELENDITGVTPAAFEPSIDYIVVKIPRFAFEKFPGCDDTLGTAMKSVGEVMALGRCFEEALQKALRGLETGLHGLDAVILPENTDDATLLAMLSRPHDGRILLIGQALRRGIAIPVIATATGIDDWFLHRMMNLVTHEQAVYARGIPQDFQSLAHLKSLGFSDAQLARISGKPEADIRHLRESLGVHPVCKRVDTCAAEFPSRTPYLYSSYESQPAAESESWPTPRRKVIILGGGPNRIGQGIEFDYCCVHAALALKEAGIESIMVNCNPETVSTDYDISDRLYFEPLTAEDVLEICHTEATSGELLGVIVQLGGQTPLKLAHRLAASGIPLLGTSLAAIDRSEDRGAFHQLVKKLGLAQPDGAMVTSLQDAEAVANRLGYPLLARPSYVLGGRAMAVLRNATELQTYCRDILAHSDAAILLDDYIENAIEIDVDALCDFRGDAQDSLYIAGILQHIHEAGIHSGDSACCLPPYSLSADIIAALRVQTEQIARELQVVGLMNIQFAIRNGEILVLEVNPRASRTIPFVAKVTGIPLARLATRLMVGERLQHLRIKPAEHGLFAVKQAVFPFNRFPGCDTRLGPEMKATGEVMGMDTGFALAFAKAERAAGNFLPVSGTVWLRGDAVAFAATLHELGFTVLTEDIIAETPDIIFDISTPHAAMGLHQNAIQHNILTYSTLASVQAAVAAIKALKTGSFSFAALQNLANHPSRFS